VARVVNLVMKAATSLRAAAAAMFLLLDVEQHWTTVRLCVMRIGLAALMAPLECAKDWIWLIDHSVQIGRCKCLVILGLRQRDYPWGRALAAEDLVLIALVPMEDATKVTVHMALEDATRRTGVPRVIVDDHGADLHGGVKLFQQDHSQTVEVYDVKHKAACLLRAILERDEIWKSFCTRLGQCKCAVQQTELAPLTPPSQRTKARFMNLDLQVEWGIKTLALLDNPAVLPKPMTSTRLEEKFGWLRDFREPMSEWSDCLAVIDKTLDVTRTQGISAETTETLKQHIAPTTVRGTALLAQMFEFTSQQSKVARADERLPASTEVLESCFGKLKYLERDQSKSGFTGLVLALGVIVGCHTPETIAHALDRCPVKNVQQWCDDQLGPSVQSQRKLAYQACDAQHK
jgi:hypothetical protein